MQPSLGPRKPLTYHPIRLALLVMVAWLLGCSGLYHFHRTSPDHPGAKVVASAHGAAQWLGAVSDPDDDCAICDWKAHTSYSPANPVHWALVFNWPSSPVAGDYRAPDRGAVRRFRNRAPPFLLS
jgi:hypothetical protein